MADSTKTGEAGPGGAILTSNVSGGVGGIPKAVFVDDVDAFMKEHSSSDVVMKQFDELYRKYKFMEANLTQKKKRLRVQIPDIKKSLDVVKFLISKQGVADAELINTHFMLSDGVYASAQVPPTDTVMLFLGANVMLEYPIGEATELLQSNLLSAETLLSQVQNDLDTIKDQTTTLEVDMARVYNWDVQQRRKKAKAS